MRPHAWSQVLRLCSYCTKPATRPAAQVVSGLFAAAYRSIYIPFWLHGNHHGHRASRLDSAQFAALHRLSPAYKLCSMLSVEDFAKAQRLAFSCPRVL